MDKSPVRPPRSLPSGLNSPDDIFLKLRQHLIDTKAFIYFAREYRLGRHEMEDLFADAMQKILDHLRGGHSPRRASVAWAKTILKNTIKDHLRHKKVQKNNHMAIAHQQRHDLDARRNPQPSDAVNRNQALARAMDRVREEKPNQARAIELNSHDLTAPEIAEEMKISLSLAKQLVKRGRERLHGHLRTEAVTYSRQGMTLIQIADEMNLPVSTVQNELLADPAFATDTEDTHHHAVGET